MFTLIKTTAARFAEPSSWAGLSGLLATVGFNVPGAALQSAVYIAAGICGLVAFCVPG
jgi:hypothetical protein